jgi:hypothetical protein
MRRRVDARVEKLRPLFRRLRDRKVRDQPLPSQELAGLLE